MKLTKKLIFGFVAISVFSAIVGYVGFRSIELVDYGFEALDKQSMPAVDDLKEIKLSALLLFSSTTEHAFIDSRLRMEEKAKSTEESKMELVRSVEKYGLLVDEYFPEEGAFRDIIKEKSQAFINISDKLVLLRNGNASEEEIIGAYKEFEDAKGAFFMALDSALDSEATEIERREAIVEATISRSLIAIIIIIIASVISAIISGIVFAHFITNPMIELTKLSSCITKGYGGIKKARSMSDDEIGDLANSFNFMIEDIKKRDREISAKKKDLEASKRQMEQKVAELQDGKSAVLNMMEDSEELNRELIRAQEKLKENMKALKETDVKKNEFMSIAAHELKTPMTSIHGFSQLLQNPEISGDPEKRDKYLKIMNKETTRLAKLVNDVLDLSRIDLNTMKFDISEVDISSVIDMVKTEMSVQAKVKGLDTEYVVAKDIPKISTDRERLTQVLMNLINNSVKYTQKGKITVNVFKDGTDVHFVVKDTGIGIAKNNQPRIFTRFYQVDSSYTRSAGGVGLGLSLCKELIGLLGGRIWFTSELGKGSEFHFTLPPKPPENVGA